MTEKTDNLSGKVSWINNAVIIGVLLFTAGCYTQLGTRYLEREPDYQEITEYETSYGDSVVVDNYYYDGGGYSHYHPRQTRYRRHFATFYGRPYLIDPFYDPFGYDPFYDDYWYGGASSLHLNFSWGGPSFYSPFNYGPFNYGWNSHHLYAGSYYGRWGYGNSWRYGYYGSPWGYGTGYVVNYGPRGSRVGRGGVISRGGRYTANEDDILTRRQGVVANRSLLTRSRTRSGAMTSGARVRGVQRAGDNEETSSRTRRGVTRSVPADRSRAASTQTRGAINRGTRSGAAATRSTPRTRSSSGSSTRSAPRTRSSSGSSTRSAPRTRSS
ncbi:MAG: hypothetical protein OXF48_01695, partial [Bacteroidetes bacterium]|nr:hypothetical protein [Bacteroidota bacterium]